MKWVSSHAGKLHVRSIADDSVVSERSAGTPARVALGCGSVHEVLYDARAMPAPPAWLALLWARDAIAGRPVEAPLVWCDVDGTFYPHAARMGGVPFERLCIVRPPRDQVTWTVAECLRCPGVAGVVATVPTQLSRVEVRRLQLAVEAGGGVGVMMRARGRGDDVYAAATRWLVSPAPAVERATQRWRVEQVHGHGGHLNQPFIVESQRARIDQLQHVSIGESERAVRVHHDAGLADRPPREATG